MNDENFIQPIRRSRAVRKPASHFTDDHHEALAYHRHDCLAQRLASEKAAGEALGLEAMHSIAHTPGQLQFLRGLVREMGAPAECHLQACRAQGICTDQNVQCYWRNREHVRATYPQVDDALMRIALAGRD